MFEHFFDFNSTTPVDEEALKGMLPYFSEVFANPSGQTSEMSWKSQSAIKVAKSEISSLLDCSPEEIVFTSGATESINWVFESFLKSGVEVAVSDIDHDASFQKTKGKITFKSLSNGQPDLENFVSTLNDLPKGSLISFMHGHNELGTVIDVDRLVPVIKNLGHFVHVDATQTVGKVELNFHKSKIDFLSCSAHKIYGPKGIGALIINKNTVTDLSPLIYGGGQQDGMRSGTLNTPLIVGFGLACKIASIRLFSDQKHYQKLRDVFFEELIGLSYQLNGDPESCLLNTINITFNDWKNPSPLFLELIPFSVSQSSACSTEGGQKRVLKTLSISEPGTLRISFGRPNTEEHVRALAHKITSVVSPLA